MVVVYSYHCDAEMINWYFCGKLPFLENSSVRLLEPALSGIKKNYFYNWYSSVTEKKPLHYVF
jgi:hypothetical protein